MSNDTLQQLSGALGSLLRAFWAGFLTIVLSQQQGVLSLTEPIWKAAINAGVGAALVVAYNWINPNDNRYGIGYVVK